MIAMLASGATVDWGLVEREPAMVGTGRVPGAAVHRWRDTGARIEPWFWTVIGAVGMAQVLWVALRVEAVTRPATSLSWLFLANTLLFGSAGALLLFGGRHDVRPRALGALFITIAAAFAHPLARNVPSPGGWLQWAVVNVCIDAFFSAALWRFVWVFPRRPVRADQRVVGRLCLGFSCALGAGLVGVNLLGALASMTEASGLAWLFQALDRDDPGSLYWLLAFGSAMPALPFLWWRSLDEAPESRGRVSLILCGLAVGVSPFLCVVVASIFIPALGQQPWRALIGVALYAATASIIPSTAYAVLTRRAIDVRLAVTRARQWRMARYAVSALALLPLTYLVIDLYLHRHVTLAAYLQQGGQVGLFGLLLVGFSALAFRHQLTFGVDKWFRADRSGPSESLALLDRVLSGTRTIKNTAQGLSQTIEQALHPSTIAVLVVDDTGRFLRPIAGSAPAISTESILVEFLRSAGPDVRFHLAADSPFLQLLPEGDSGWILGQRASLIAPLLGAAGSFFGLVVLGEARHGLPYSDQDYALLRSMCAHVGLRIENQWLREHPSHDAAGSRHLRHSSVNWRNEPAETCPRCSRTWPPATTTCACGAAVAPAALPFVTAGKFQLERQLGAGGMGVVYLATDLVLGRRVAVKTLPRLSDVAAARLQREARAMATVLHPNLALIYGAEQWRDRPVLIVEYVDGGTVLDGVRRGPFTLRETLGLGILMADVLERLHLAGILHRDVKPSNIGYTLGGSPKLLDLGLASVVDALPEEYPSWLAGGVAQPVRGDYAVTSDSLRLGTLKYMAPDALAGEKPRPAWDLWALTVVLYEVLAGRHPLAHRSGSDLVAAIQHAEIPDIREIRPDCPDAIAAFFRSALSLDRGTHPTSARELRGVLQHLLKKGGDANEPSAAMR